METVFAIAAPKNWLPPPRSSLASGPYIAQEIFEPLFTIRRTTESE